MEQTQERKVGPGVMGWFKKSAKPILTRWYLLSTKWFGIKLHHIHKSDPEFHNHPWWGISIIFGWYWEEYEEFDLTEAKIQNGIPKHLRIGINVISPWRKHRVITNKPVWTLFFHGPRINDRWVYGNKVAPWRGPDT